MNIGEDVTNCASNVESVEEELDDRSHPNSNALSNRAAVYFTEIHSHCSTCIKPLKCAKKPNFFPNILSDQKVCSLILNVGYFYDEIYGCAKNKLDFCPVVRCINGDCNVITHYCKLEEHYQLCQFQMVHCINRYYGCPQIILRKSMSEHLRHCPANVVHCGAEWNRYPIYYEKGSSARCFYSPHGLDVNNLDVALALRDQRMLTQLWTASRQMKRIMRGRFSFSNPAVPIKPYIGIRTFREYTSTKSSTGTQSTIKCANIDEESYVKFATRLVTLAYHESLLEILKLNVLNFHKSKENSPSDQFQTRQKSNSICQMTVDQASTPSTSQLFVSTSVSMPSSSSINLPISTETEKYFSKMCSQSVVPVESKPPPESVPPPRPPPVPNCNTLSLQLSIQSLPSHNLKPRSIYSFRCGLDFRKDELASHYRDIHNMIIGGLDGWIEHRCPLFVYGCPFVHRRWSPNMPNTDQALHSQRTLVFNSHLEAFACPSTNSSLTNSESSSMDSIHFSRKDNTESSECITSGLSSITSSPSQQYCSDASIASSSSSKSNISIDDFPFEILQHICTFLDSYSLNNMSLTSKNLRLMVQTFLKKKGYVTLQWKRYQTDEGTFQWRIAYLKWMFSTSIEPINAWTMDSNNVIAEHLQTCQYNDRVINTEPFRIYNSWPEDLHCKQSVHNTNLSNCDT